jgi:hypothetical protein
VDAVRALRRAGAATLTLTRREAHIPSPTSKILVLAREALAAALVGLLLELDKYEPAFALPDESPEEAVRRVRPVLIIILDGSLDAAASDVFYARAKGTPVVLFGTPRSERTLRELAEKRKLRWFTMPIERERLSRLIGDLVISPSRSGRDRRRPSTRQAADGTLIFRDREGSEWQVYDRRAGDRRGSGASGYRAFVNEAGEEWRCELSGTEARQKSPAALEKQFARAVRHIVTSSRGHPEPGAREAGVEGSAEAE